MMARQQFEVVPDDEPTPERYAHDYEQREPAGVGIMLLALKALSQRALTAITDLFTLITVFGAWWLWYKIPDPTPNQIVSLSIFAAFVLAANWLVRRK